jgi:hypothetical protein
MKRIDYPKDLVRIQSVLMNRNVFATILECENLWYDYSGDMCAGWMRLPCDDEELWDCVESYVLIRAEA